MTDTGSALQVQRQLKRGRVARPRPPSESRAPRWPGCGSRRQPRSETRLSPEPGRRIRRRTGEGNRLPRRQGPADLRVNRRRLDRELGAVALIEAVVRGDVPRRVLVGDGMSRPRRPSRRAYLCNGADLPIASGFPFSGKPETRDGWRQTAGFVLGRANPRSPRLALPCDRLQESCKAPDARVWRKAGAPLVTSTDSQRARRRAACP